MFIVLLNRAGFKCRAPGQSFQLHIRMVIEHTIKGQAAETEARNRHPLTGLFKGCRTRKK
ncbi:hypothetical protein DWY22_08075 [Heyndrickxia coagulans]|nr:hypothetical protein DWY22_08075 [Heyndrickxia coagulans]RGR98241.1 hypothetical protein DWY16_08490 [Heyndrickxia coagulans]